MYIPVFALRKTEKDILKEKLTRITTIKNFNQPIEAYIVEDRDYDYILNFVEGFREGINEASDINSTSRSSILRAVTLVFNLLLDCQKIKDPDIKTSAMAGIASSIIGIMNITPEYGIRLISIIKSKL